MNALVADLVEEAYRRWLRCRGAWASFSAEREAALIFGYLDRDCREAARRLTTEEPCCLHNELTLLLVARDALPAVLIGHSADQSFSAAVLPALEAAMLAAIERLRDAGK